MLNSRPIGRTGLAVTEFGFGGASVGNLYRAVDDDTATAAVRTAWQAGIRYFDTAPHYGLGLSERRLGRALAAFDRQSYVLSTKAGRLLEDNPHPTGSDLTAGGFDVPDSRRRRFDFSRDGIHRSLADSLGRLGVDRVDVVYLHDPDDHLDQAVTEGMPALVELRDQGVVGAIGVGMNNWADPLRLVRETPLDVVMLAGRWTLLDRTGAELLDECAERDVAVVAAAPYNSGLLARPRPADGAHFNYQEAGTELVEKAHRLADTCERFDVTLPAAALQFPLRHPAVVSVVAGVRTAAQADEAIRRLTTPIPAALWAELDG